MQRSLGTALLVALLGSLVVGAARSTSCVATLEWRGETYVGLHQGASAGLRLGPRIRTGVVPPCGEATRGCAAPDSQTLTVLRLGRVDPAIAIAAEDMTVYTVSAYVGSDPRHPLHRALYGAEKRKRERRGWTCGSPTEHSGLVTRPPLDQAGLSLDDQPAAPRLDSRTSSRTRASVT